jgi:hypothetical protein
MPSKPPPPFSTCVPRFRRLASHPANFSRWAIGIPHHPYQERGLFDLQKSKIPLPQSSVDYLYNEEAAVPNLGFDGRLFVPLKQTTLPPSSCHLGLKTSPFVEGCFHPAKV